NDLEIYGFEALSRPHSQSILNNPEMLFKLSLKYGFYVELEKVAWEKSLEYAVRNKEDKNLFMNCNAYLFQAPDFGEIIHVFNRFGLDPSQVFLEITERSNIKDFAVFEQTIQQYRQAGFRFAVDDVGGGFSSLESIISLKPEVVKIDRHIINGVHKDNCKRSLVQFINSFCKENKILSLAEGIETRADLMALKELGVDLGQGYYLFRPSPIIDLKDMNRPVDL
ncbi:MAG: EAL domain-containing protein, partial [Candidatus Omnitrophica bacterium]|nr:EAL domain-containing protein [Candidatus Omnitrophota bacterium]